MVNRNDAAEVGSRVEEACKVAGISLLELADRTGIAYTTLHRKVKKDSGSFKVFELALIALELNVSIESLLAEKQVA
ncbi:helix-turn-helix domain-containing protein [Agromyces sp. NPDC058064]|uniref:helix-turn-helix domain-containing protein n=1 Tax=Agromyces sp. NPDC058064 TaxID=3346322 RepID=UPI0036DF509B